MGPAVRATRPGPRTPATRKDNSSHMRPSDARPAGRPRASGQRIGDDGPMPQPSRMVRPAVQLNPTSSGSPRAWLSSRRILSGVAATAGWATASCSCARHRQADHPGRFLPDGGPPPVEPRRDPLAQRLQLGRPFLHLVRPGRHPLTYSSVKQQRSGQAIAETAAGVLGMLRLRPAPSHRRVEPATVPGSPSSWSSSPSPSAGSAPAPRPAP